MNIMTLKLKEVDNLRMSNRVTVRFYSSKNALNSFSLEVVRAMYQKLCSIHHSVFNAKKKTLTSKVGQVTTSLGDLHTDTVRMRVRV